MSAERVPRIDWIIGGLALVLVIVLLELPWYTVGGGTVSGIELPSISEPATGSPSALFGLFGVIATLAVLLDLVLEHLSPDTNVPAIGDSRTVTRLLLAGVAAFFLALKFVFNLSKIGNFGVGCWLGLLLVAALVYATMRARRQEPERGRQPTEAEVEAERSDGNEQSESETSRGEEDEARGADAGGSTPPPMRQERLSRAEEQPERSSVEGSVGS